MKLTRTQIRKRRLKRQQRAQKLNDKIKKWKFSTELKKVNEKRRDDFFRDNPDVDWTTEDFGIIDKNLPDDYDE